MRRHRNNFGVGTRPAKLAHDFQPVEVWHVNVSQDDIESFALAERDGLASARRRYDIVATQTERNLKRHARATLVIND